MRSPSSSVSTDKIRGMRPRPDRLDRLPQQYFAGLLARVAAAQAQDGPPVVDLGRGNPDIGPPAHVVERLYEVALQPTALVHGYAPFLGLPELKEAIAARYATSTASSSTPRPRWRSSRARRRRSSSSRSARSSGARRSCFRIPGTRTTRRRLPSRARARSVCRSTPPRAGRPTSSGRRATTSARSTSTTRPTPAQSASPTATFEAAIDFAEQTGAAVMHDFAYGDLVYDGRTPRSFLATPGAREVGIELFSFSKSYGMAGWRLGFALGNAEIVARLNLMNDHVRAGIFRAVQEAGIAALTGPQDSVEARRARLRGASQPRVRHARRDPGHRRAVRGDVLRLVPASRRDHRGRRPREPPRRPGPGRRLRRDRPRAGPGSRSRRSTSRSTSASSGSRTRSLETARHSVIRLCPCSEGS